MGSRDRSSDAPSGRRKQAGGAQAPVRSRATDRLGAGAVSLSRQQELFDGFFAATAEHRAGPDRSSSLLECRGSAKVHARGTEPLMPATAPLLSARLSAGYPSRPDVLNALNLEIAPGEILGLVGESGSGKSTLALALLRLLEFRGGRARGELCFRGRNLLDLSARQMRAVRGRDIALVLQSPLSALNPAVRIGRQIQEAWRVHSEQSSDLLETLATVNLPAE